jgi:hypothetical protein
VLSAIDPNYVGALSLMLIPETPLFDEYESGAFQLIEPQEMLSELRTTCRSGPDSQKRKKPPSN